jgi:CRP-like cAMP-binding protein
MAELLKFKNHLLSRMSPMDIGLVAPHLERHAMNARFQYEHPGRAIEYVYFIEQGLSSVFVLGRGNARVEAGLIGREGMSGIAVIMGSDRSVHATLVQVAGEGFRITSDSLRRAMNRSSSLRDLLVHYAHAFLIQVSYTALANGQATLEERLARWMLMAHDRLTGDLVLTHEFLALVLGVRRAGVTQALQHLESRGFISAKRGSITVTNRPGLEQFAHAIYGGPEAEYARLTGCSPSVHNAKGFVRA